ncbi:MAG: class II aldolase/adducin family protein [Pseudolabrys sp.]
MTDTMHEPLKRKLIAAGKVLAAAGQGDFTRGHISVRMPGKPALFYMKPHSVGLDEITLKNILTIGLDGNVVAGKARRHSEVYIHSEIYRARDNVHCVIHSHPPYAVALSASGRPIKAYSQPGALFAGDLGSYCDTIKLIRTPQMGAALARALGRHRAVLMKNHGVAVAAASIEEAVVSAIMLENAATIQMIAEAAGSPAAEFPRDDVAQLKRDLSNANQFAVNFNYLVRRLKRGN